MPDPENVLSEVVRVLAPDGVAVVVTPNRLTFARPDEIIDPYHYVEFSPDELRLLCQPWFEKVELLGLFGSERYGELVADELAKLHALLRKDPLRLRRLIPRGVRKRLYDRQLWRERQQPDPACRADRGDGLRDPRHRPRFVPGRHRGVPPAGAYTVNAAPRWMGRAGLRQRSLGNPGRPGNRYAAT